MYELYVLWVIKMSQKDSSQVKEAITLFRNGLYCSEAILQVFNKHLLLGLDDNALKMATCFGAGLGGSKCCCGALTGAILVLSAVNGRVYPSDSIEEAFAFTNALHDRFKERYKSTCCRVLTKNIEWGSVEHVQHCETLVGGAVEILEDILSKNQGLRHHA